MGSGSTFLDYDTVLLKLMHKKWQKPNLRLSFTLVIRKVSWAVEEGCIIAEKIDSQIKKELEMVFFQLLFHKLVFPET